MHSICMACISFIIFHIMGSTEYIDIMTSNQLKSPFCNYGTCQACWLKRSVCRGTCCLCQTRNVLTDTRQQVISVTDVTTTQCCKYNTLVDIQNTLLKASHSLRITYDKSAVSLLKRGEQRFIKVINNNWLYWLEGGCGSLLRKNITVC